MKTFNLSHHDIKKEWILIDAKDLIVGRAASRIALYLMGKHKPTYTPFLDCGDNVIVINAEQVVFTGRKATDEKYYWHTGYVGGIKEITPKKLLATKPEQVMRKAVKRMLGDTPLGRDRLSNLYVYAGEAHPHEGQKPRYVDLAALNRKNHR
ncbi:MAG: 50S ribosomal protein L13 [Rickettsiales bacterium]|jgi:large subunit ribosomal protein L13|nr:50S ribosomal protein L13 [Rickettsiales bacterium]